MQTAVLSGGCPYNTPRSQGWEGATNLSATDQDGMCVSFVKTIEMGTFIGIFIEDD